MLAPEGPTPKATAMTELQTSLALLAEPIYRFALSPPKQMYHFRRIVSYSDGFACHMTEQPHSLFYAQSVASQRDARHALAIWSKLPVRPGAYERQVVVNDKLFVSGI
jgi:hypothetical protein